jgi:uncharacterized coiled-coil protein SlyX
MTADDRLSRMQGRAVAALLTSRTLTDAAAAAQVSEKTIRRWMATEPFAAAYRSAARESARESVSALLAAQREAIDVLRTEMHAGTAADRVRAARALLELGSRAAETDLDQRILDLEEAVAWDHTEPRLASTH